MYEIYENIFLHYRAGATGGGMEFHYNLSKRLHNAIM